ncbi:MAG: alkaline phosphatase, partial [Pseudomonadota bacterium]
MKQLKLKATTLALITTFSTPFAFAEDANTWLNDGAASLAEAKKLVPNVKRAKNVILFLGDGMGISTITAARI